MKNLYLLPTDKPSRLSILNNGKLNFGAEFISSSNSKAQHIYITSDEEIKEGYYLDLTHNVIMKSVFYPSSDKNCKKIILTTDQDLIKDGVQAIDDEFLEWFVNNPSCEEIEISHHVGYTQTLYFIVIPKEETLEEFAERLCPNDSYLEEYFFDIGEHNREKWIEGAKWQQERSFSEEDMREAFESGRIVKNYKSEWQETYSDNMTSSKYKDFKEWFEQFKKK